VLQASIEIALYKHALERQLEEREAWLRTTLASAAEAIVAADRQGRVLLLNPAAEALTGWSAAEAQGRPVHDVVRLTDGEAGKPVRDLEALAILGETPVSLDRGLFVVSRTGAKVQVEGSVAPVAVSSGPAGVVISLHDVTARQWRERRLRQAQRMETAGRLAASVASDFASLVAVVRAQAAQLASQFAEYSPARRAIEEIQQAAAAADQITRRLESFSFRPAGQTEVVSLNSILRRLTRMIETSAGEKLAVAIQPQPGAGRVQADVSQLEQAIVSLVLHACSVTPAGGTLLLETARVAAVPAGVARGHEGAFVALTVSYSAQEPDLEHLFDPAESERGFALALTQAIVAEQGGFVSARRLPEGTEIQIFLPLAGETPAVPAGSQPGAARTLLLIEPRERVRAHLHNVAEAAGYNLLEASDPAEAAALCEVQDTPVDLLIGAAADVDAALGGLSEAHRPRHSLRLVEGAEKGVDQLQAPFTQRAWVARIAALTGGPDLQAAAAAQASSTSS
jgi:PAS domain S-box-containing protein